MARPIVTIPTGFLGHVGVNWDIDWRDQSNGDFNSGLSNTTFSGLPRWKGTINAALVGKELANWRGISATAGGRYGVYRLRMVDPVAFLPKELGGNQTEIQTGKTSAQGNLFSGGVGWEYDPIALASESAPVGATTVKIDTTASGGYTPKQGQIMSHGEDWPFVVVSVRPRGSNVFDLGVRMAIRAPIAAGDVIRLGGIGRFQANDSTGYGVSYNASRVETVDFSFSEVITR